MSICSALESGSLSQSQSQSGFRFTGLDIQSANGLWFKPNDQTCNLNVHLVIKSAVWRFEPNYFQSVYGLTVWTELSQTCGSTRVQLQNLRFDGLNQLFSKRVQFDGFRFKWFNNWFEYLGLTMIYDFRKLCFNHSKHLLSLCHLWPWGSQFF